MIIVAPFLDESGLNSWASAKILSALSNEIDQNYFLPTVWKLWASKVGWFKYLKKMIFTVLWEITVALFLDETGPNLWISENSFKCPFKWDQPRVSISISLKDIAQRNEIGQTPEKNTIFTVLWEITVAPFLKETGQNSWDSERFFYAFLNETGQKYFLPTV